jgi:hypothetical protein
MSSRPKRWQTGCRRPSEDGELAKDDAGGDDGTILRFNDDLLAVIKGEDVMSQDTLANEGLVT